DRAVRAGRHRPHSAQEVLMARRTAVLAAVPLALTLVVGSGVAGPAFAAPARGPATLGATTVDATTLGATAVDAPALRGPALAAPAVGTPVLSGPAVVTHYTGTLADGATWVADVPGRWRGVLILYSHGFGTLSPA